MQHNHMSSSQRTHSGPTPAGCTSAGTGQLLPDSTLPTPSGTPVALSRYSGRRNLVVLLLGAGTPGEADLRLLSQLAQSRTAIDEEEAQVLVVQTGDTGDWPAGQQLPFTVLVDGDAAYHRCVGAADAAGHAMPSLFITDRYREIYHAFRPTIGEWPPDAEEVLSWLVFMNIQCPECGVPEW